jgi:cellulose synthase/poly-beta-1,6-N-acetylglucosamine synthase-like glycosyltransferase
LGLPYKIVCGESFDHPNVVYRHARGKYDAINFGSRFIPKEANIIVLNDVDTIIHNFHLAFPHFNNKNIMLVFGTEVVKEGPQKLFFRFLNPIRHKIPIAASGELMFIRRDLFEKILPLKPCKAEDTYILFKVLEYGYSVIFSKDCYTETERTTIWQQEVPYKRRTVSGIYQALSYTNPSILIRLFYYFLPFFSPSLLILGKRGYYWMKGILQGFSDYLRGDRTGYWDSTY